MSDFTVTKKVSNYDRVCAAIELCARVDDLRLIQDESEALRRYRPQVRNPQVERWYEKICLRAERRIGEILNDT